jgi:hypothetical protein
MAAPLRMHLSGSTNGLPIPVAATSTPGTTVHIVAVAPGYDALWIFASNVTGSAATLTVEWGGTSDPGDHLVKAYSIAANSAPVPIALGQQLTGGVTVKAFSGTASAINLTGWAIRKT